tara:strand:+ start:516 stop:1040 length:525 start_codon:yes stop_codon:yes gene_type:complete
VSTFKHIYNEKLRMIAEREAKKEISEAPKKKKSHDCASKVKSEEFGIGYCIPEQHTMLEDGTVTHYDVEFDNYIVENYPVNELKILASEMHDHADNEDKAKVIKEKDVKKKKKSHDCASKVEHKEYGIGTCIPEQHTLLDDGTVTHYDVMFEKEIIENVPVTELKILASEMHKH